MFVCVACGVMFVCDMWSHVCEVCEVMFVHGMWSHDNCKWCE